MPDVKLPQFPMGVQVSGEDMIPAAQNGTSGLIKVKDVRNIGSTIAEGGAEKTASNENLKTVDQKVETLSQSVDTSFKAVNQNFTNVENEIQSANNAINAANQNVTNHEEDTALHVTQEKQNKWDGYGTQLLENTQNIAQLSNPNLLINGDFKVWQRATSFTVTSEKYTADRWTVLTTNGAYPITVEKVDNGLKLTQSSSAGGYIKYKMEDSDLAKLTGKIVTLSYSLNDIIYTNTFTVGPSNVIVAIPKTGSLTGNIINWVKLEMGSIATPFVPKPYAEELVLCQRYYESVGGSTWYTLGLVQSDNVTFSIIFTEKRIGPTITFNEGVYVIRTGTSPYVTSGMPTSLLITKKSALVNLVNPNTANIVVGTACYVRDGTAYVDAEIY